MKKRLLLIVNPVAGKAIMKQKIFDVTSLFQSHSYEVILWTTMRKDDAYEMMIKEADDYDLIICAGGDGTLNEVVRACMECHYQKPIGYLPTGTTNDFATTMHLAKDPLQCAKQVMLGSPFACDVGMLNEKAFAYIAAFGVFTDISYTTSQSTKNILGHGAYMIEGLKKILNIPKYRIHIAYDGKHIEDVFCYGMITNSLSIGGFSFFKEDAIQLDDGYFECVFVKNPNNPLDLQQLAQAFLTKDLHKCPRLHVFKAKEISIYSEEEIAWTVDGEFAISCQNCTISNKKQAIRIIR